MVWDYAYVWGYETERHLKAFEQIGFAPIPHAACPTRMVKCAYTFENCYMLLLT